MIWLNNKIRRCDIYGKTITFTYKGEDQYTTFIGGVTTIAIMFAMLTYTSGLLKTMIEYKGTNSSVNTIIKDLSNDTDPMILSPGNFEFLITIIYFVNGERKYYTSNDTVFSLNAAKVKRTYDTYGYVNYESEEVGYSN